MDSRTAEQSEAATPPELPSTRARAFLLRARGYQYRQIASELGVSVSTAYEWVKQASEALEFAPGKEEAERARDLAALDDWIAKLRVAVDTGEIDLATGARTVLPFYARRAAIIGYEAPRKSAIRIEPERENPKPDLAFLEALQKATEEAERQEKAEEEASWA